MKYALYFFGGCMLALALVLWSIVSMALGAVSDAKELIAQAPIVIEKTHQVVEEVKQAGAELEAKVTAARDAVANVKIMDTDKARDVGNAFGEIGRSALKRVMGENVVPEPADTPDAVKTVPWIDYVILTNPAAAGAIEKALYADAKFKKEEWLISHSSRSVQFTSKSHEGVQFVRNADDAEWTLYSGFGTDKERELGKFAVPGDVDVDAVLKNPD